MRSPQTFARRSMLLALSLVLAPSVDCIRRQCQECELPPAEPSRYEMFFTCDEFDAGEIALTAGSATDTAAGEECFQEVPEAEASEVIGGVAASVRFFGQNQGSQMVLTCAYEIGADLAAPLTCAGTTQRLFGFQYLGGTDPIAMDLHARKIELAEGTPGAFTGAVTLSCFGQAPVSIPLDGTAVSTGSLPHHDGDCEVDVTIDSATASAGATEHSIAVYFAESRRCQNDAACEAGERCGPEGRCQLGNEGDRCATGFVNATMGDCNITAPICRVGQSGLASACQDGSHGDFCTNPGECTGDNNCVRVFFTTFLCQDGRQGSYCETQDHCEAGQTCFISGPLGICTASCTDPTECLLPFGCVPIPGSGNVCAPCSADEHCAQSFGEVCVAGECVPGP